MTTITSRKYVLRDKGRLVPTDVGRAVNKILVGTFPDVFDVSFTATMEEELDGIEEGKQEWHKVVQDFWDPLSRDLAAAETRVGIVRGTVEEESEIACPNCGKLLVRKFGRRGAFLACPGYPECKFTRPVDDAELPVPVEGKCDLCGAGLVARNGPYGRFISCSRRPECKFTKKMTLGIKCPGLRSRRDRREAHQARQAVLQLHALSGLQVRGLGQAAARAVPELPGAVPGREGDQEGPDAALREVQVLVPARGDRCVKRSSASWTSWSRSAARRRTRCRGYRRDVTRALDAIGGRGRPVEPAASGHVRPSSAPCAISTAADCSSASAARALAALAQLLALLRAARRARPADPSKALAFPRLPRRLPRTLPALDLGAALDRLGEAGEETRARSRRCSSWRIRPGCASRN